MYDDPKDFLIDGLIDAKVKNLYYQYENCEPGIHKFYFRNMLGVHEIKVLMDYIIALETENKALRHCRGINHGK